jgi:hypothetical protein
LQAITMAGSAAQDVACTLMRSSGLCTSFGAGATMVRSKFGRSAQAWRGSSSASATTSTKRIA